jgi:ComF family protein
LSQQRVELSRVPGEHRLTMATPILQRLVALLVPPLCAVCREPELSGEVLCPGCRRLLIALPDPRCARCGAPAVTSLPRCPECRGRALAFQTAWAPVAYESTARGLVSALKSRGATPAARAMASEIASRAPPGLLGGTLVPVPAHPARQRREGMNQAACLAAALGRAAGLPVRRCLRRQPGSRPQVGLARGRRLANARGSVSVEPPLPPGRIVLVDDVYTTGATLDACARALSAAGAREVAAVTFARATR